MSRYGDTNIKEAIYDQLDTACWLRWGKRLQDLTKEETLAFIAETLQVLHDLYEL